MRWTTTALVSPTTVSWHAEYQFFSRKVDLESYTFYHFRQELMNIFRSESGSSPTDDTSFTVFFSKLNNAFNKFFPSVPNKFCNSVVKKPKPNNGSVRGDWYSQELQTLKDTMLAFKDRFRAYNQNDDRNQYLALKKLYAYKKLSA
jgi:hypothetical protein